MTTNRVFERGSEVLVFCSNEEGTEWYIHGTVVGWDDERENFALTDRSGAVFVVPLSRMEATA